MRHTLFVMIVLMLFGCTMEVNLREIANPTKALTGCFRANGSGHGEAEIKMPDGELIKGEYSLVKCGSNGFSSILNTACEKCGRDILCGAFTSCTFFGGTPGTASGCGNKGTSIKCEFYNENFCVHGYGACQTSTGTLYQLRY
jgi:hypothetical protein